MVDTEEKQLQCMEDLYAIVKAQPKFQKMKEPAWTADTDPIEVILYLIRKLAPLAGGNRWTIDTWQDKKKTRFCFVHWKHYHKQIVRNDFLFLPLDFLPALEPRDKPLHDLIVDTVAIVSKNANIPLWDEDGDYSEVLKEFINPKVSTKLEEDALGSKKSETLTRHREIYRTGIAARYLKLIKDRRREISLGDIFGRPYKDNSNRKKSMKNWILYGLDLASEKGNMKDYSFVPHYSGMSDTAVSPHRSYKFMWSVHDKDPIHKIASAEIKEIVETNRNQGREDYLPVEFSVTHPGQVIKPLKNRSFPELACEWMTRGWKHLMSHHRPYYYKQQMDEKMTPAEQLLEAIELSDKKKKK